MRGREPWPRSRTQEGERLTTDDTSQKRLGAALFYGIIAVLAILVYLVIAPFLVPLAWAVVLVVVAFPVYERMARRWGRTTAALAATFGVTLILILPTMAAVGAFVQQGIEAARAVQHGFASGQFGWADAWWLKIQQRLGASGTDLGTVLRKYGDKVAEFVALRAGEVLKNTAVFLFNLGVTVLAMFYLFRDGEAIVARLREILPFEAIHRERMLSEARDLIFASVISTLAAATAYAILGGVAFAATGIRSPVFWGVMMGFCSLVPVAGSALIWVPAAASLVVMGHTWRGIALAAVCVLIVAVVDNVVRPWLISGRAEMGGLLIFISVLGGISVFGMLGIVLGPIIVATAAIVLDLYTTGKPPGGRGHSRGQTDAHSAVTV